jgi:hypothetical protein
MFGMLAWSAVDPRAGQTKDYITDSPHAYMSLHSAYYPDSKPTNRCSSSERKRNKYQLYNPWFAPYVVKN